MKLLLLSSFMMTFALQVHASENFLPQIIGKNYNLIEQISGNCQKTLSPRLQENAIEIGVEGDLVGFYVHPSKFSEKTIKKSLLKDNVVKRVESSSDADLERYQLSERTIYKQKTSFFKSRLLEDTTLKKEIVVIENGLKVTRSVTTLLAYPEGDQIDEDVTSCVYSL
jgi:hypothetical protein